MNDTMLKISFTCFERDPPGQMLFVSLTVRAVAGEFSGQSDCVVVGHDLEAFLVALEALARTSQGEANLVGGWGDAEYIQLRFAPRGSLGHIGVRVRLRDHDPSGDFRFEGSFVTEPQSLMRSYEKLHRALCSEEVCEFEIYVRSGSAA